MDAGVPRLLAVDHPLVAVALGVRLHVRRVGAVLGLGDAEREAPPTFGEVVDPLGLLLVGAVHDHEQQADVVADDRVLVLQVAVQAEALAGEVLADHGHAEVRAVLAAVLLRERVAVVAGGVGAAPRLAQQRLPLVVRQAAALPVGARVLAAMVEEADVVVLLLERLDLALDELVELVEVVGQILRDVEVHGVPFQSDGACTAGSVSRSSRFSTLPAALRGSSSLVIQIRVGTLNEREALAHVRADVVFGERRLRRARARPRRPPRRSARPGCR